MLSPEAILLRKLTRSIFRANNAVLRYGDLVNEPFGQSSARWRVLDLIFEGNDSVAAIARATGLSRQAVQRVTDGLVAEHLAVYHPHPTDGRKQVISLTDSGRAIFEQIEASYDVWAKRLMDQIGTETARDAIETLESISQVLNLDLEYLKESRTTRHE